MVILSSTSKMGMIDEPLMVDLPPNYQFSTQPSASQLQQQHMHQQQYMQQQAAPPTKSGRQKIVNLKPSSSVHMMQQFQPANPIAPQQLHLQQQQQHQLQQQMEVNPAQLDPKNGKQG